MSNIEQWLRTAEKLEQTKDLTQIEDILDRGALLYETICLYGPCPQELKPRLVAAMEKKANG